MHRTVVHTLPIDDSNKIGLSDDASAGYLYKSALILWFY